MAPLKKNHYVGIVGHEAAKFTKSMELKAKENIREILNKHIKLYGKDNIILVSGGCHLGGIDIWAEEIADELGLDKIIYLPKNKCWTPNGYRERNLNIAHKSNVVFCIVVTGYHKNYKGMKFKSCYHCDTSSHIKSGGCWTAKMCRENYWIPIPVTED